MTNFERSLFVRAATVFYIVFCLLFYSETARPEESGDGQDQSDVLKILLLGFDSDKGRVSRTDAMLIVIVRRKEGQVGVISVPRDLWVDIPGAPPGRINQVYRVGERLLGKGGGPAMLLSVIETQIGVKIDRTLAVDFSGFEKVVDLVGGIYVDVECPIEDRFHTRSAQGAESSELLSLEQGRQLLDGRTALLYARSRHGRSDADREQRQQAVLLGLKERIVRLSMLPQLPRLWLVARAYVASDLSLQEIVGLATSALELEASELHGLLLEPPIIAPWSTLDGKQVVLLDKEKARAAIERLFDAPALGTKRSRKCKERDVALRWRERLVAPNAPQETRDAKVHE